MEHKKYLITGAAGFVSGYFIDHLLEKEPDAEILAVDLAEKLPEHFKPVAYRKTDLLDGKAVHAVIEAFKPDYILHLAAVSSVSQSWKDPRFCFVTNTGIFLNLAESVKVVNPECVILSVGSSEEYGPYPQEAMPLKEEYALHPVNPYSVAKNAQEQLAELYVQGFGMKIILTRSFNHFGPYQKDLFVIPSFVKQLVECKVNNRPAILHTGNIDVIRDFLDVRDVVDAYYRLLHKGESGQVYNICSGKGTSLRDLIKLLGELLELDVKIEIDPARVRPTENPLVIGDNSRITAAVGWAPRYDLKETLGDMIAYYKKVTVK